MPSLLVLGPLELALIALVALAGLIGGTVLYLTRRASRTESPASRSGSTVQLAPGPVGFAVLYRWRLVPGREDEFQIAWERLTHQICEQRGGLGSRLHRGKDGVWWAYAQWPSEARWRAAHALDTVDAESSSRMAEAILERFDPVPLTLVADLLVRDEAPKVGVLE